MVSQPVSPLSLDDWNVKAIQKTGSAYGKDVVVVVILSAPDVVEIYRFLRWAANGSYGEDRGPPIGEEL